TNTAYLLWSSSAERVVHPCVLLVCYLSAARHRDLHPFPTRRSSDLAGHRRRAPAARCELAAPGGVAQVGLEVVAVACGLESHERSEEHTSELQSRENLVCRLLLEKKKKKKSEALSTATESNIHTQCP